MGNDFKNISVRLNDEDYNKLESLTKYFNEHSYFEGSLADTLRIAVKKMYTQLILEDEIVKPKTIEVPVSKTVKGRKGKKNETQEQQEQQEQQEIKEDTAEKEIAVTNEVKEPETVTE